MVEDKQKTYWPHMIVGFLMLALTLSYWTVKSASSLPVQEVNEYMMKYQQADIHINDILEKKLAFDKEYNIEIQDVKTMVMTDNIHSHRPQLNPVVLTQGKNHFTYVIRSKEGQVVNDANVSFLLTRPHTRKDDLMIETILFKEGTYTTPEMDIVHPGRYTLQFRAIMGDKVGYSEIAAYLPAEK